MKAIVIFLFFIILASKAHTQVFDSLEWEKSGEYSISQDDIWSVDVLGNVYITKNKALQKFDSTGVLKFSQSIKSFGRIKEIQSINTMKLVTFSEEQQTVCILDNTLTLSEECLDLSYFDIGNASHIAVSGQPDKLWVVDQLNSKLLLLSLNGTNQFQEIKNLKGILNATEIVSIQEAENHLFLVDSTQKIFEFDLYGSLINVYEFGTFNRMTVKDISLVLLLKDQLNIRQINESSNDFIELPTIGISEVKLSGKFFYFRTENKILKYELTLRN
ncbi:MAG: hypothetical protein RI883_862 [Bacteroidota bacterium]